MSDLAAERQTMEVDLVCVGFGPAMAGFLTTLAKTPGLESRVAPGMPLQVICYERADDIGFGVSGVVTRARGIRATLPDLDLTKIPMAAPVLEERLVYLLDPVGASRRSGLHRALDVLLRPFARPLAAIQLPYIPPFLSKHGGLVLSIGQFLQYVGGELMGSGTVQIWPGTPVAAPLLEDCRVVGVRLADQGVDREGLPEANYLPGMDVRARLTVVADGPVGAVGQQLNERPPREWALGMKMLVDLPANVELPPGTVIHTLGFPEPEIFGFLYVHAEQVASVGIFVPSWFRSPTRTGYRYLQRFLLHPYIWRFVEGGRMRSWGAKSILESGRRDEPALVGVGYARIGEGSGSTNPLAGSGVDEAWATGAQLADAVVELSKAGQPLTRENLEKAYVARRRASWVEKEARMAERARNGFHRGFFRGLAGMALAGFSRGRWGIRGTSQPMLASAPGETSRWPEIPYDGQLLVSHQDALLMGGKVQAPPGFADHVRFLDPATCVTCAMRMCIEMCSGQAITAGNGDRVPMFDREKCVHCGACLWNCPEGVLAFEAGAGGLHSNEN